jgi:hypothetical protein
MAKTKKSEGDVNTPRKQLKYIQKRGRKKRQSVKQDRERLSGGEQRLCRDIPPREDS